MDTLCLKAPKADEPLREDRFTTLVKRRAEQFPYWQALVAPVADVALREEAEPGFDATVRGHDLGKLKIASLRLDAMHYRRTPQLIRRSPIDHWQIVLRRRGSEINNSDGSILRSVAGSLDLRSLARPCAANSSSGELVCIWMPRDNFSGIAANLDAASHKPIPGAMKNILREFILALERHRSALTVRDVPAVTQALTALLGAVVRPTADGLKRAAVPMAASQFEMARRYIDAHLSSPDLSADALCREIGVCRRKLYHLFERSGGVSRFIRERRLAACHAALESLADVRLVSTIAYDHGFADPAQFSRLFKAHFGYTPKEARERRSSGVLTPSSPPQSIADWLLRGSGI